MKQSSDKKTHDTLWALVAILVFLLLFLAISSRRTDDQDEDSTQELLPAYEYTLQGDETDVEDVVLFSDSGVTITVLAMGRNEEHFPYLVTAVDNQSDHDIIPQVSYCAVNGVALQAAMEGTVKSGDIQYCPLTFSDSFFLFSEQTEIGTLQIELSFLDADTQELQSKDTTIHEITFREDVPSFDVSSLDNVIILDSEAEYRIYYVGTADLSEDEILEFVFYIIDDSETPIYFESGDLMVDGIMQADYTFGAVAPGNGVFVSVSCDDETYQEAEINEAMITFSFFDENYNNLYDSGELRFRP